MEDLSRQVQPGMDVYTSDGTKVGKVAQIWFATTLGGSPAASEEETCFAVQRGLLRTETVYLPCRLITSVESRTVKLNVDASTIQETPSWHRKPPWVSE